MKLKVLVVAMLAGSLAATAWANVKGPKKDFSALKQEMAAAKAEVAPPATDPTGDADSFGRNVRFIGLLASGVVQFSDDCTPDPNFPPGADDHCQVVDPAVLTSFDYLDVARMVIPANASNSLYCHWQTPIATISFFNPTASTMPSARFQATARYTIQNAALNDPALINPDTGLPFNGKLVVALPGVLHTRSLAPGESGIERENSTRTCIGGLVSKRALVETYGLTAAQATNFFKKESAITMDIYGSVRGVQFGSIIYSNRFVGD